MNDNRIKIIVPEPLRFLRPVACENLMRIGRAHDGGYVIPASLIPETEALLSLGIEHEWSFDAQFKKLNHTTRIHGYDHTISARSLGYSTVRDLYRVLRRPSKRHIDMFRESFNLLFDYMWFWKIRAKLYTMRITNPIEKPYDITLDKAIKNCHVVHPGSIFIKMDIEGSEYATIEDLVAFENLINGMVIEFHDVNRKRDTFTSAIHLLQTRYDIVHLHGNNFDPVGFDGFPETLEITWVNKRYSIQSKKRERIYLDGIDAPNREGSPDYFFEF